MVEQRLPTPDELEEELGLTPEEADRFDHLVARCEAGASRFTNDDMSSALVLVSALRNRWAAAHGAARTFADGAAEIAVRVQALEEAAAICENHGVSDARLRFASDRERLVECVAREIREAEAAARAKAFLEAQEILSELVMKQGGMHYRCGPCDLCGVLHKLESRSKEAPRG